MTSYSFFTKAPLADPVYFKDVPVIFAYCDPAGIGFYPRLIEIINNTVEEWFEKLGFSFARMHGKLAIGVPTVNLQVEFSKACRLGEVLKVCLHIEELRKNRLSLRLRARCRGEMRWEAVATLVCVRLNPLKSINWPNDLYEILHYENAKNSHLNPTF
jgi:4-hydroxybenzoyl-CoA thioesterase